MIDSATILVADDNSDDIELLRRAIKKAGLTNPVLHIADGAEVIKYFGDEDSSGASCPLLMFLDLNMPHCSGFAVLDWLRSQPHLQNLPIIIFSNSDRRSDMERSFDLGARGYWVKPARFDDLVNLMVRLKTMLLKIARRLEEEDPIAAAA